MNQYTRKITNHKLFDGLNKKEKDTIEYHLEKGYLYPREFVYRNDDREKHIYLIYQGTILIGRNFGKQTEIAFQLTMIPIFLGIESFLLPGKNNQFARAMSDVYYCKIKKKVFIDIFKANTTFQSTIRNQLAKSMFDIKNKYDMLHSNVIFIDRMKDFLIELSIKNSLVNQESLEFNLHMTHHEIAMYLQTSRQSVSHCFSQMRKQGIIDYGRSYIKILDKERLMKWKFH